MSTAYRWAEERWVGLGSQARSLRRDHKEEKVEREATAVGHAGWPTGVKSSPDRIWQVIFRVIGRETGIWLRG